MLVLVSLSLYVAHVVRAYDNPVFGIRGEQTDSRWSLVFGGFMDIVSGREDALCIFVSSLKLCIVLTNSKFI